MKEKVVFDRLSKEEQKDMEEDIETALWVIRNPTEDKSEYEYVAYVLDMASKKLREIL